MSFATSTSSARRAGCNDTLGSSCRMGHDLDSDVSGSGGWSKEAGTERRSLATRSWSCASFLNRLYKLVSACHGVRLLALIEQRMRHTSQLWKNSRCW
jgi:hypothetical protein